MALSVLTKLSQIFTSQKNPLNKSIESFKKTDIKKN